MLWHLHHRPMQVFQSAWSPLTVNYALGRPRQHSHAAAHCVPNGPWQGNHLTITAHRVGPCKGFHNRHFWLLWAGSSSSQTSPHSYHGPIRAFISAASQLHVMWAHTTVSCGSSLSAHSVLDRPMRGLVRNCLWSAMGHTELIGKWLCSWIVGQCKQFA